MEGKNIKQRYAKRLRRIRVIREIRGPPPVLQRETSKPTYQHPLGTANTHPGYCHAIRGYFLLTVCAVYIPAYKSSRATKK